MSDRARLELNVNTLAERVGVWFCIWRMPLFSGQCTEVRTESPLDDGRFELPLCIGEQRFAALIQDAHPRLLICDTKNIVLRLDMNSSMLEMISYRESANKLMELVRAQILALRSVPKFAVPEIGYRHRGVTRIMNSHRWAGILYARIAAAAPGAIWVERHESEPRRGEPGADANPALICAGEGDAFLIYDRLNDQLLGGRRAPDIWPRLRQGS